MNANYLAATCSKVTGEAINISTTDAVTVNTVVDTIKELLGKNHIEPIYTDPRAGDIKHSLADISKAKKLIGFEPSISFDQGIRRAIDWYRENL